MVPPPKAKDFSVGQLKFLAYFCSVKQYYRHIALWLCLPSLLLSTGGFSFHTLYCLCKGETQVSLLFIPDPCARVETTVPATCCAKSSVCHKPVQIESDDKHQHDCAERGFFFAKLNTPFLFSASDYQLKPIFPAIAPLPSSMVALAVQTLQQENFLLPPQNAPPPPSGMDLRRFLKSYRC